MRRLRIGILGSANIAQRHILPALNILQLKYKLAGIASRDINKANLLSSKFHCKAFDGYESLLEKGNLDVVYIPLPNAVHFNWIVKSLERGIHVISEKSLCTSLSDTQKVVNIAREKKLAVFENFQFRFHSQLYVILDLLKNKTIGELRCVRSSFGFPPFQDENNIRNKKELGGGALLDAGAYPIKISQIFLGENLSVKSAKLYYDEKTQVDTWGGAFISDNNSALFSEIAFGFDNYYQCSLELWGSKGRITADRIFTAPPGYQPSITVETSDKKEKENILLPSDNHFVGMFNHVYKLIADQEFEDEYRQNITQARLIEELRNLG